MVKFKRSPPAPFPAPIPSGSPMHCHVYLHAFSTIQLLIYYTISDVINMPNSCFSYAKILNFSRLEKFNCFY